VSPPPDVDALVVGAGIAGLAAARELERLGAEVLLVEADEGPGGVMKTVAIGGYRLERGPNSLLLRAPLLRGLEAFGLTDALERAAPSSRSRFLLRGGQLVAVPMGPLALARSPLLSGAGKRRLLREPFVARGDGGAESVAEFVGRRLGNDVVEALVGPFLAGVYAGDERRLGAEAVFPSLVEAERTHGSIVRGLLARARGGSERGRPGTYSASGGLGALSGALAAGLRGEQRYASRVRSIECSGGGFAVELDTGGAAERLRARRIVIATPARAAAELVRSLDEEASAWIAGVEYAPVATVSLGAAPASLQRPPSGFGFLVPRGEGRGLLGCLFMSELFADRAPPGRHLLHCLLGGTRAPEVLERDDAGLAALAIEELAGPLGATGDLEVLRVGRWRRAVAQPLPGHASALRDARARLAARGPIALAGGYTDGVSVGDSFASGLAAAEALTG